MAESDRRSRWKKLPFYKNGTYNGFEESINHRKSISLYFKHTHTHWRLTSNLFKTFSFSLFSKFSSFLNINLNFNQFQ